MAVAPWMPLWVGDYRADTGQLNQTQHGAYLLLIMEYWQSGPLPDNDRILARVSLSDTLGDWLEIRPALERFFIVDAGVWHHHRVDVEIEKAKKRIESARKGANLTNLAKWGKSPSVSPSVSPKGSPKGRTPTPSPQQKQGTTLSKKNLSKTVQY